MYWPPIMAGSSRRIAHRRAGAHVGEGHRRPAIRQSPLARQGVVGVEVAHQALFPAAKLVGYRTG